MTEVGVKTYIRNGRVVRGYQRRGRPGRGAAGAMAGRAASVATRGRDASQRSTQPASTITPPKGSDFSVTDKGYGVWTGPDGKVIGYSWSEDSPIMPAPPSAQAIAAQRRIVAARRQKSLQQQRTKRKLG